MYYFLLSLIFRLLRKCGNEWFPVVRDAHFVQPMHLWLTFHPAEGGVLRTIICALHKKPQPQLHLGSRTWDSLSLRYQSQNNHTENDNFLSVRDYFPWGFSVPSSQTIFFPSYSCLLSHLSSPLPLFSTQLSPLFSPVFLSFCSPLILNPSVKRKEPNSIICVYVPRRLFRTSFMDVSLKIRTDI